MGGVGRAVRVPLEVRVAVREGEDTVPVPLRGDWEKVPMGVRVRWGLGGGRSRRI